MGRRAAGSRREFPVREQKATDAKRKGEAKVWMQLKTFWVAVVSRARYVEGLEKTDGTVPAPLSPKIDNSQTER